ncbi:MAG: sensor histidine kinase [Bacteroidetes bacterium]|nr:sensor histidine kinase [Bacteroidota bacterium]
MQKITDNIFLLILLAIVGTFLLAAAFIFFFLKYQRNISKQKEAMQKAELEHGEQLLQATLLSQEDERKRIGQDLHDDVGASLSNLKMSIAQLEDADGTHKLLIDNIINRVRTISHSLSPPGLDLFGLEFTLTELFDSFNATGTLEIQFDNRCGQKIDSLNKKTALALYRVMQELLNNTIKHSGAKHVAICFDDSPAGLVVSYADNGKGLPETHSKKSGMGMQNIEARLKMIGATFLIPQTKGKGFAINITLPGTNNN